MVQLHRVSREACGEIVASLLGEVDGADAIVDHVYTETGGNPGAIERVVQALVASDAIVSRRTTWVIAPELGGQLPKLNAEAEVRAIAMSLLDRLGEEQRRVARVAANIGETFDADLLEAALGLPDLQERLNRLVAAQVIEHAGSGERWHSYRFTQRALRVVLTEQTSKTESREISEALVAFLSSRPDASNNDHAAVLARHIIALGRPAEATEVVAKAIDLDASPPADLVELLRQALKATDEHLEPEPLRWCELAKMVADIDRRHGRGDAAMSGYRKVIERVPPSGIALSIGARCELGELLMGDADESGQDLLRSALEDAKHLGDDALIARAAYSLANRLVLAGHHDEATGHVSEALLASERAGDEASRARTLKLCATLNWLRGRLDEAERYARKAADEYRRLRQPQGLAVSLGALGTTLVTRGDMDRARAAYTEALEHAHEAGWLTGVGKLEDSLAAVAYHSDDWDGAEEHQAAAIAILDRVGNRTEQVVQMLGRAFIAMRRGEFARSRQLSEASLELARRAEFKKGETDVLSHLGELSLAIGALGEADDYLSEANRLAVTIGAVGAEIESARMMLEVELARHAGPLPVLQRSQQLLERAEEASLKADALHISRVAGVALARLREPNQAKEMLDRAHEGFTELGSRYEAARTVRIMAELVTQGLIEHEDMEEQLRKACRVFRRLRAQPELDAARRIRDRLGIPPSSVSLLAEDTGMPRDSAEYVPEVASSAEPRRTADWDDRETTDDVPPVSAAKQAQPPSPYESGPAPASSTFHDRPTSAPISERELVERAPTRASFPDLVDVSRRLSEILELEELLAVVIDAAIASSSAQRGFVIACDRAGHPTLRVSRGLGGLDLDDDLELSRTAVGRVIATRQRVHWQADETDRPNVLGESVMLLGLQAIVALPMINRGQLWGVLYLDTRIPDSDLTGSAMAPLEALAPHAAVARQNARQFEEHGRPNELIASAINELRHPLDALQRCAEIAYQQSEGMPTHRLNQTVRTHARRLNVMVERVLELATTEPAKVDASKVSVQVRDLVDSAILQLRPVDDIDDTPLEIDVPWALPTVLGHREQLIQVIASMVAAALHRSPPDATVSLVATVTDAPMPDDDSDPFFPPAPHQLADDGAVWVAVSSVGTADAAPLDELGLATAREMVEHHGGHWRSEVVDGRRCLEALLPSLVPMPDEEPASAG
ncbi:MAG: tetratricopeptide repeat protein [Polyangiaceae bacterium]